MNYELIEVESSGTELPNRKFIRAISNDKQKLENYCLEVYGKKTGEPKPFNWDNYFIIEETEKVIIIYVWY